MSGGRCEISRGDTCGAREAQFIFVLADHCYAQACVRDGGAEDARNSLREFAVADYGGFAVLADVYLLQDFACGGERLGEDGGLVGDIFRDTMQIYDGQR